MKHIKNDLHTSGSLIASISHTQQFSLKQSICSIKSQRNPDRDFNEIGQADYKINMEKQKVKDNKIFLKNRIRGFIL